MRPEVWAPAGQKTKAVKGRMSSHEKVAAAIYTRREMELIFSLKYLFVQRNKTEEYNTYDSTDSVR